MQNKIAHVYARKLNVDVRGYVLCIFKLHCSMVAGKRYNLFVVAFTALISCGQCVDVRLGADGRVPCPDVNNVNQVVMLIGVGTADERQIGLYSNNQNFSDDKYILAADFSAVIIKDVTISDQNYYQCYITQTAGSVPDSTTTTLSVYGEQYACVLHVGIHVTVTRSSFLCSIPLPILIPQIISGSNFTCFRGAIIEPYFFRATFKVFIPGANIR